jgi:hypothetical protein
LKGKVDVVLSKGPRSEKSKCNNQDLKVVIKWYKRAGDMAMPKNKEGLLLSYLETCGHVVTYKDPGFTDVDPRPRQGNPNSTVTTHKNFAAAALEEGPSNIAPALAPTLVPTPDHGGMINDKTKDRNAASAAILALDPAA